jgi:hypothetical protein
MEITRLQPDGLVVSPAFSHVAVVPAGATTIYVGGQNGVDADGKIVSDDVAEQSARAIDNASTPMSPLSQVDVGEVDVPPLPMMCRCSARSRSFLRWGAPS